MSTAQFLSALLSFCTSLVTVAALAIEPAPPSALELELGLARRPQVYLVIDIGAPSLEVKARGMVLDRTPLQDARIAALQPVIGRRRWPEFVPPILWRVAAPPAAEWRQLVAPTELRPYDDADSAARQPTPAAPATELPSSYTLMVDAGWQLVIADGPSHGLWQRLTAAVASSWRRWTGKPEEAAPPRLVLSMAADDARRLLHVFQENLPILVVLAQPSDPGGGGG